MVTLNLLGCCCSKLQALLHSLMHRAHHSTAADHELVHLQSISRLCWECFSKTQQGKEAQHAHAEHLDATHASWQQAVDKHLHVQLMSGIVRTLQRIKSEVNWPVTGVCKHRSMQASRRAGFPRALIDPVNRSAPFMVIWVAQL
jgi:hypothetical protein